MAEKPKRPRKDGGTRCAAWGCDNSKLKDNIGVFEFPCKNKEPERFSCWCKVVKRTRMDFRYVKGTSRLCAAHFDDSQIANLTRIKSMREADPEAARKIPWRLASDARPNPALMSKRPIHGTSTSTPTPVTPAAPLAGTEETPRRPPRTIPRTRLRPGAAKLERKRTVQDAMMDATPILPVEPPVDCGTDMNQPLLDGVESEQQPNEVSHSQVSQLHIHLARSAMKRKPHRSIRVQARPTTFTQGTQTDMLPTCVCQAEGGRSSEVEQLPSESGRAVTDVTLTDEESLMDTDDESTYPEKDDDPDYVPDSDESEEEQDFLDDPVEKEQDPMSEKKYLVSPA
ncbi:uncharacterized protein LOC135489004 [Lineus longissimus]|uniref:uncharacterized protein LOC135489004 n=1 Tax=Lineus longissimus TaxID=88925 RepID=UPI002B4D7393